MTEQTASATRRRLGRSRWAAAGAAVAVTLGGGGLIQANAAGNASSTPALFIATTPCRLIDTRDAMVGTRSEALGANDTYSTRVIGANGRCTIPSDATTLVMNVTAVNATASSFMTVFPTGSDRPDTSSLNWDAGSSPTANAVTANVSASGELSFFNHAGSVDLIADVVGYYTSAPLDDFYTKAQVDALIEQHPGPVGPQGERGEPGADGVDGVNGVDGADGVDGVNGVDGANGDDGAIGPVGPQGDIGPIGRQGQTGPIGPQGTPGDIGPVGPQGPQGTQGDIGQQGPRGDLGPLGPQGTQGDIGPSGPQGEIGPSGPQGKQGDIGPRGQQGDPGQAAPAPDAAVFYSLHPADVPLPIGVDSAVPFVRDGPTTTGSHIVRLTTDTFRVTTSGMYRVTFALSVNEPGQLGVRVNDEVVAYTIVGRATGTSQITGDSFVDLLAGQQFQIVNSGSASALSITPRAGGMTPVASTLTIELVEADPVTVNI